MAGSSQMSSAHILLRLMVPFQTKRVAHFSILQLSVFDLGKQVKMVIQVPQGQQKTASEHDLLIAIIIYTKEPCADLVYGCTELTQTFQLLWKI